MTHHHEHATDPRRIRTVGDRLARGIRRLDDIRRRSGDDEILAVDPATCLDLQAESSVTVGHAAMPRMPSRRKETG